MPVELRHPDFPAPTGATKIWRYSSFAKLLASLVSESIYLTGLPTLQADDPFEGANTIAGSRFLSQLETDPLFANSYFGIDFPDESKSQMINLLKGRSENSSLCFVSCWHASAYESAALWKLYSNISEGVAIRSTIQRLARAMTPDRNFILGAVTYHDYEVAVPKDGQILSPIFMKRQSFEHEKEVRLLYWAATEWSRPQEERAQWAKGELEFFTPMTEMPSGLSFRCDTAVLIEEVLVSPYAQEWIVETVAEVLRRLGCKANVKRSNLMDRP